ncbi:MAG: sigma-70 family RNA polymerase sigma factor [Calditrichaeota bacterium]|nr:MAG: sigma-70 family RNA polymerase sigma factor [Calditrichota bacterium]MBL1207392.1 sigma-70 family RNA polymerase sigma factor [Calditrichota bacterium]NOG47224.1 sigma-70 family RNA polymerase sigma factor [Calditrichota bacterium]
MSSFGSETSFQSLITLCQDPSLKGYQGAWREFLRRYKQRIYQIVFYRCDSWQSPRVKTQLKDIVNDIVSLVFKDLPKSIKNYREVSKEKIFLLWLTTICNRAVSFYFKDRYIDIISNYQIDDYPEIVGDLPLDNRWELFELITDVLTRDSSHKRNVQRDLVIFLLYTIGNFKEEEIKKHHCFKEIGPRVVEVTVSRKRKILKENLN